MDPSENKNTSLPTPPLSPQNSDDPTNSAPVSEPQKTAPIQVPKNPLEPTNKPTTPGEPPKIALFDNEQKNPDTPKGLAENIIKLEDQKKSTKTLLGDAPILDESLIDRTFIQKRKLKILYSVFIALAVIFMLSYGFFYSQLNPDFTFLGANIAQNVNTSNQEIQQIQTNINEQNALMQQMVLNNFSVNGNKLQDLNNQIKSPKTSEETRQSAQAEIPTIQTSLVDTLQKLKQIVTRPTAAPIYNSETQTIEANSANFIQLAKQQLSRSAQRFANDPEQQDEFRLYNNAAKILGNAELSSAIINSNISSNEFSIDEIAQILNTITSNAQNEFSIINSLKAQRVNWNQILSNIVETTKIAGEGLIVANEGITQMRIYESGTERSILYSNYNIDAATGQITVAGTLRTPDEKTFTTMANLIESFESSPNFRDINYRSFAKSGSPETGYESNFQIEFFIENSIN